MPRKLIRERDVPYHPAPLTKNAALGREAENVTLKGRQQADPASRPPTPRYLERCHFPTVLAISAGTRQRSVNQKRAESRGGRFGSANMAKFEVSLMRGTRRHQMARAEKPSSEHL